MPGVTNEIPDPEKQRAEEEKAARKAKLVSSFSTRTPKEILGMTFDPADFLIDNGYLSKGDPLVILGQGGLGKSRIVLQLGIACVTGLSFFGWRTRAQGSKWLFLQTENSNRRLQNDLQSMTSGLPAEALDQIDEGIRFHTLENDDDALVSLANPEAVERLEAVLEHFAPTVAVFDVLRDFATGDLNSDAEMAATCREIGRVTRRGNPKRIPLVVHHARTGKFGASQATGFDRGSFGRNSKVLQGWTRAQINLAPVSADSNDVLVVASGKANNSEEFEPFAVRLDPESMTYEPDPDVDLEDWRSAMGAAKAAPPKGTIANIVEIVEAVELEGISKAEIVKKVMTETGCSKSQAYRLVDESELKKAVVRRKTDKLYVVPAKK